MWIQQTSPRVLLAIALISETPIVAICEGQTSTNKSSDVTVFRAPFTLKLHVDKEHYYEEEFTKMPYVYQNDVYLFKDDAFGINFQIDEGKISKIAYQTNRNRADVTFTFSQEVSTNGEATMMLVIQNQSTNKLFMDAMMTVPGKKGISKTTIMPLRPRLGDGDSWSSYESWPHPIVQLLLRNFRLNENSVEEKKVEPDGQRKDSPP